MNPIVWSEEYLIGDARIDQQHQNIVKLINELIEERITAVDSRKFQTLVMELVDYAYSHLTYEEKLLSKIKYPQYDEHKLLHEDYIEQFSDFALETLTFESGTPERMLNFLIGWWNNHILIEDMKYRPYL